MVKTIVKFKAKTTAYVIVKVTTKVIVIIKVKAGCWKGNGSWQSNENGKGKCNTF